MCYLVRDRWEDHECWCWTDSRGYVLARHGSRDEAEVHFGSWLMADLSGLGGRRP